MFNFHIGAINATAHKIKVATLKEPKPSTLRDHMPAGVGKYLLETTNQFANEMLAGKILCLSSQHVTNLMGQNY